MCLQFQGKQLSKQHKLSIPGHKTPDGWWLVRGNIPKILLKKSSLDWESIFSTKKRTIIAWMHQLSHILFVKSNGRSPIETIFMGWLLYVHIIIYIYIYVPYKTFMGVEINFFANKIHGFSPINMRSSPGGQAMKYTSFSDCEEAVFIARALHELVMLVSQSIGKWWFKCLNNFYRLVIDRFFRSRLMLDLSYRIDWNWDVTLDWTELSHNCA